MRFNVTIAVLDDIATPSLIAPRISARLSPLRPRVVKI
jgi:hypothetical protein